MIPVALDFLGNVIGVGDKVVYAAEWGGSTSLKLGVVVDVLSVPDKWDQAKTTTKIRVRKEVETTYIDGKSDRCAGQVVTIERLNRVVVIGHTEPEV